MNRTLTGYIPPVGFYYAVQILGKNETPFPPADAGFQEVSGISVKMETVQIQEGGQNRFAHQVPGRTNYENLVLKRGLMVRSSALADWCNSIFKNNLNQRIEPKTIKVSLLDANEDSRKPIMTWQFVNAYPIQWQLSPFDAQKSEIVVESITFAYSYFDKLDENAAKDYPLNKTD